MTPKERLAFLADALEKDAANEQGMKFDLNQWLVAPHLQYLPTDAYPPQDCGTVGCAVGLAMLLPEFQAEGLQRTSFGKPWVEGHGAGYDSAAHFFGLTDKECQHLFSGTTYGMLDTRGAAGELNVVKRIREYLEQAS